MSLIKIDMHSHSLASDGRFTPIEAVEKAKANNVELYALTDHDTVSGLESAILRAKELNLNFIPGIELSTEYNGESIHVLGYFRDDSFKDPSLISFLDNIKERRIKRAYEIVDRLKSYHNIIIDINKVLENGEDTIARPHIAKAIIDAGYDYTMDYIFNNFIGNGCPAYIPSSKVLTKEGIDLLKKYNCLVVLAHPILIKKNDFKEVSSLGFDGIEGIYYQNSEKQTNDLIEFADTNNLLITAGSDCHGIPNDTKHGDIGDSHMDSQHYEKLIQALSI